MESIRVFLRGSLQSSARCLGALCQILKPRGMQMTALAMRKANLDFWRFFRVSNSFIVPPKTPLKHKPAKFVSQVSWKVLFLWKLHHSRPHWTHALGELPGTRKIHELKWLCPLDDKPNPYLGSGWKSPFPSIKNGLFRLPGFFTNEILGITRNSPWGVEAVKGHVF